MIDGDGRRELEDGCGRIEEVGSLVAVVGECKLQGGVLLASKTARQGPMLMNEMTVGRSGEREEIKE